MTTPAGGCVNRRAGGAVTSGAGLRCHAAGTAGAPSAGGRSGQRPHLSRGRTLNSDVCWVQVATLEAARDALTQQVSTQLACWGSLWYRTGRPQAQYRIPAAPRGWREGPGRDPHWSISLQLPRDAVTINLGESQLRETERALQARVAAVEERDARLVRMQVKRKPAAATRVPRWSWRQVC